MLLEYTATIPAMTSAEERACYYRLTREQVAKGSIIEMGCWLGASTAAIACAIRDSNVKTKVHVYDRFEWDPSHERKGAPHRDNLVAFQDYMGPLLEFIEIHKGEISDMTWGGGPVALTIFDAPKRIPMISTALRKLAGNMGEGSIMVWQDFAYFPSYDIPAALAMLSKKLEFIEAVPGTTAVFRVKEPWTKEEVSPQALALTNWKPEEIVAWWEEWHSCLPASMIPRFDCGAALFLYDLSHVDQAVDYLAEILAAFPDQVVPKWRYLINERSDMRRRYPKLVKMIESLP